MHGMNPLIAAMLQFIESGEDAGSGATSDPATEPPAGQNGPNEGEGGDSTKEEPNDAEKPAQGDEKESAKDDDEPLGENGRKALQAERAAKAAAEQRAKDADKTIGELRGEAKRLNTELTNARKEATTATERADGLERELWLFRALAEYPVPEEHRHLIKGNTEEELTAAAKSVAELTNLPGVVRTSGTNGNTPAVVSSIAGGRELYRDRHASSTRKD